MLVKRKVSSAKHSMATMKRNGLIALLVAGLGVLEILELTATEDSLCQRTEHPVITYKGKEKPRAFPLLFKYFPLPHPTLKKGQNSAQFLHLEKLLFILYIGSK